MNGHACSANLRFWVRGLLAGRRGLRVDWSWLVAVEEPLGFGSHGGFELAARFSVRLLIDELAGDVAEGEWNASSLPSEVDSPAPCGHDGILAVWVAQAFEVTPAVEVFAGGIAVGAAAP
ncbi:MAG: hypothetical protein ACI8X5_001392 [Planctomycetota bacterium]